MAAATIRNGYLEVGMSRGGRVAGLLRNVRVPVSSVRAVRAVEDGMDAARGVRAPGLALPGFGIGTWRRPGATALVSVRRGQAAARVEPAGQRYDVLLVGLDDAPELADGLAVAAAEGPA